MNPPGNKAQQDAFFPRRGGTVNLTVHDRKPSFEVISALLSRCRVFTLRRLTEPEIRSIIERALKNTVHGLGPENLEIEPAALDFLAERADGDARRGLNYLHLSAQMVRLDRGNLIPSRSAPKRSSRRRCFTTRRARSITT